MITKMDILPGPATKGLLQRLALTAGVAFFCMAPGAQSAGLPVACAAGTCGAGPSVWISDGAATAITNAAGTRLDITQTTNQAILNWAEFNIAAGKTVNFNQPGKASVALNRIYQSDPSRIFGALTANGQIYLINQNGILFGAGSQVNTGSLIASSLAIADEAATGGILNPNLLRQGKPAFDGQGRVFVLDQNGQVVTDASGQPIPVKVVVEMGATIKSDPTGGGRIALLGQQVENAGKLESPGGQVVLAAGQKVYLQASTDPELRGLLVEVDAGGKAWNQLTGEISTPQGNTTLVGLAVNQDGRINATTSVRSNGSVRLLARDTVNINVGLGGAVTVAATNGGSVTLGTGSTVEVLPDATDTETAVDEQKQSPSRVEISGRQIHMESGSTIVASGGEVTMAARANPSLARPGGTAPLPPEADSSIRLDGGSLIDVSGSTATTSVTRNAVSVELRANELKDSPLQRDGVLRGETVVVDARVGTPLADVSGAVASIKRDVRERTSAAGTVALESRGAIAMAEGAKVDVSGGEVVYTGGLIRTSQLVTADGRVVDISRADPNVVYTGIRNPVTQQVFNKWGVVENITTPGLGVYDPGYVEGRNAGTVSFAGRELAINGTLVGQATPGILQRSPANVPLGGRLVIGLADGQRLPFPDFLAPSIHFSDALVPSGGSVLELPTQYLYSGGFTRTELYSNGLISLDAGTALELAPGSSLRLTGSTVALNGRISAPSGQVVVASANVNADVRQSGGRPGVNLGTGAVIDTSGRWINDTLGSSAPTDSVFVNGGTIDLGVPTPDGELSIGDHAVLKADAGAQLTAAGKLVAGKAGQIAIQARGNGAALATGRDVILSAYGLDKGGSLTLAAGQIRIADGGPHFADAQRNEPLAGDASPYVVTSDLFTTGGFQNYKLIATGGRLSGPSGGIFEPLEVAPDTLVQPTLLLRSLDPTFAIAATGTPIADISRVVMPPDYQRPAANLSLSVEPAVGVTVANAGDMFLAAGSRIATDPGGSVTLTAPTRVRIDGQIDAPAGTISVRLATPSGALDQGYDPDTGIFISSTALLRATGAVLLQPSGIGLRQGDVLDGGTISLAAERGVVNLAAGSTVDVSGTSTELDLPTASAAPGSLYERSTVGSRGGAIELVAPEGFSLAGNLLGHSGLAGGQRPEGGSLSIGISRQRGFTSDPTKLPTYPTDPRQIILGSTSAPPAGDANGTGRFDPAAATARGFDSVRVQADDAIVFAQDTDWTLANALKLEAPVIRAADGVGSVKLAANYLAIGPRNPGLTSASATAGTAGLRVSAGLIDFFGNSALQGFGSADLRARSDIRATGLPTSAAGAGRLGGSFAMLGDLTLAAAQIYPTTLTDFSITAGTDAGSIRILPGASAATPVLAGGGKLAFRAADIFQGGTLRAPLGEISLEATRSLTLAADGLTSVSANGQVIPFGRVQGTTDWVYEIQPGVFASIKTPPEKRISLKGNVVDVTAGAVVDISGGGNLFAYEFVPGPGGSRDALTAVENPNLYAVLPGFGSFGAYDTQEYAGTGLRPGDSVYLEGVAGLLPAGTYALLPSRYALLPGAVLVEARPGVRDLPAGSGIGLSDGTPLVAGYATVAGTTLADGRTTGFAIRPGNYGQQLAEYDISDASSFFARKAAAADQVAPLLPADAGLLQIEVGDKLALDGSLRAAPDKSGRGSRVDLSANRLRIVAALGAAVDGVVDVLADALMSLGAESLLLGGTRSAATNGTHLALAADSVTVAAGARLTGPEVILAASDNVTLESGAELAATGSANAASGAETLRIDGSAGGAVVRVSRNAQADIVRPVGALSSGDVDIQAGARVAATGSLAIDAAGKARSFGQIAADGAAVSLGSGRLVLAADQAGVDDGLALTNDQLAAFSGSTELRLIGRQEIAFAGPVALGTQGGSTLARLILDSPKLAGAGNLASLNATTIVLRNSGTPVLSPAGVPGVGNLEIVADQVLLDGGSVAVQGFAGVQLEGRNGVGASGDAALQLGGDLTIRAPFITGSAGSDLIINAAAHSVRLESRSPASGAQAVLDAGLGAGLDVEAGSIFADTRLVYPSGAVRLAADGDMTLAGSGSIDAAGRQVTLGPATVATPGGAVTLASRTGNVSTATGTRIDVSSGGGRAEAGTIAVLAGGLADLAGELSGSGSTASLGGAIRVIANAIGGFAALNGSLDGGGFSRTREFHTGSGDLVIAAGERIQAREVTLVANGGSLLVDGSIDVRADGGGTITLGARDDLQIRSGAVLDASNTAAGAGGEISLTTSAGEIDLAPGSAVLLAGGGGTASGSLLLRAPATGSDVGIASLAGSIVGAAEIFIEPVLKTLVGSVLDELAITDLRNSVDAFMASAADAIRSRLGLGSLPGAVVRPGLELDAAGDLLLASDFDLADWRYAGEAGFLTIRAAGDLSLQGNLSDGFRQTATALEQIDGPTWAYRLVGGADLDAVLPLETRGGLIDSPGVGSIELGDGILVRTGTGSIDMAAAADLVLAGPGSTLYTAGVPAVDPLNLGGGSDALRRNWLRDGGDITLRAGRDILAQTPEQLVSNWSIRTITGGQARWAIDVGRFRQGVAALGGGDVRVLAARDIRSLSAMIATTSTADPDQPANFPVWGGGNLEVRSGRDILSGFYSTWQGAGLVRAGRDMGLDPAEALGVSTLASFGTGHASIMARRGLQLGGVINPTTIAPANSGGAVFYSYGADDALDLTAIGGNLRLLNDSSTVVGTLFGDATQTLGVYPATVRAFAPSGDLDIVSEIRLLPAPRGQLELVAGGNLRADSNGVSILLADTDPDAIPVASRPTLDPLTVVSEFASGAIHAGDGEPVLLVAAGGNLSGGDYELAKQFIAYASRDIRDLEIFGQHTAADQLSVVQAGRDIVLDQIPNELELGGPGRLQVLAGRTLDLGFSRGISTIGATRNPQLSSKDGAALDVWLGLSGVPAYQAFINAYLVESRDYDAALVAYVKDLTSQELPPTAALAAFLALDRERQRPLLQDVFFTELRESGREANLAPDKGFSRGEAAVEQLFPKAGTYTGDLSMFFSRMYTLAGGDLNLLVPGGLVNVGLANLPRNLPVVKKPSDLGIVTQGPGDIRIFSKGDVLVNQSRVFTLQGGDIVIWSNEGNIDAGRGAKSAISAPPPTITVSATGQIEVRFSDAIAGSGIRGILTSDDIEPGDVDLIAPTGEVNAGDAGIGSAGNINIAAPRVVGLDNIQVGGIATGVPADSGGVGAALSGASSLGASAAKAAESSSAGDCADADHDGACDPAGSALADAAMGWLEVFVEGFGEPASKSGTAN